MQKILLVYMVLMSSLSFSKEIQVVTENGQKWHGSRQPDGSVVLYDKYNNRRVYERRDHSLADQQFEANWQRRKAEAERNPTVHPYQGSLCDVMPDQCWPYKRIPKAKD